MILHFVILYSTMLYIYCSVKDEQVKYLLITIIVVSLTSANLNVIIVVVLIIIIVTIVCVLYMYIYIYILVNFVDEWIHFIYTFRDNTTHYKTESVHCLGLMNSATKI